MDEQPEGGADNKMSAIKIIKQILGSKVKMTEGCMCFFILLL